VRHFFCLQLIAPLLGLIFIAPSAQAQDCVLQRFVELPIEDNELLSPIVSLPIDGQMRRVLLDTGGISSMIGQSILTNEKLKLANDLIFLGLRGAVIDSYVTVNSLGIGPVEYKGAYFSVAPAGSFITFDATLGASFLASLDVEIDPIKNTASFFLANTCGDRVVRWPHQDMAEVPLHVDRISKHIKLPLMLNGKEISAVIDTGASETFLSLRLAERLFDLSPKSSGMQLIGPASQKGDPEERAYRYQFQSLTMGDISFKNPWITLAPTAPSAPDLILGMHQLHGLHLYFSYGQQKLYLTTARGDIAAAKSNAPAGTEEGDHRPDPLDEMNAKDHMATASADLEAGNYDAALAAIDKALQLAPSSGYAYLIRARIEMKRDDRTHATEDASHADRGHESDPGIYLDRLNFYAELKDWDLAYKDADKLLQLQPKSAAALNRRCWYGGFVGKFEVALADCEASLAIEPKNAATLDSRAFVQFKAGQLDQALASYNAALSLAPKYAHAMYGRALVEQQQGQKSDAEDDIAAAKKREPNIAEEFER